MIIFDSLINHPALIVLIAIGCVLFLIVILAIIFKLRSKHLDTVVFRNSPYLNAIREINEKYNFYNIYPKMDYVSFGLDSKRQFDNFNYLKTGSDYIIKNAAKYEPIIEKITYNIEQLPAYKQEIDALSYTNSKEVASKFKMKPKQFVEREKLFGPSFIKRPITNYTIEIRWRYTTPRYRNTYTDKHQFGFSFIKKLLETRVNPFEKETKTDKATTNTRKRKPLDSEAISFDDIPNIDD